MHRLTVLNILMSLFLLVSCDFYTYSSKKMSAIDSIEIKRYDRVQARYLTTGDFSALQEMNTQYPTQTRALIEDFLKLGIVNDININKKLLEFYQDTTLLNIIFAAESEFADMTDLTQELKKAFKNLKKELPEADIPFFYAQIGALDQSIIIDNDAIGISLDKYLGKGYPAYHRFYDKNQRESMSKEYIVPDVIVFYLLSRYGIRDFYETSQHERDVYMGILMYTANKFVGRVVFKSDYVTKVSKYMRKHPNVTIKDMLQTVDYSSL